MSRRKKNVFDFTRKKAPRPKLFFFHFPPPRASFFPRLFFRPHVVLPPAPSLMVFLSNLYFTSRASSLHSHCHDVSCERMQPGTLRIIQSRVYPAAGESRPIRTPAPAVNTRLGSAGMRGSCATPCCPLTSLRSGGLRRWLQERRSPECEAGYEGKAEGPVKVGIVEICVGLCV